MGRRNEISRRGVASGGEGCSCERGVTAIGSAEDANALGIGDALGDQVLGAPGHVILHLASPLQVAGVDELLAISGGTAEVHAQHGITAVGNKLRVAVVAPNVAAPSTAVRQDNRRKVFTRDAFGQREVAGYLQPV